MIVTVSPQKAQRSAPNVYFLKQGAVLIEYLYLAVFDPGYDWTGCGVTGIV